MPFLENLEEFTKRQGCDSVRLENGHEVFSNGAICGADIEGRLAFRSEPSPDRWARLQVIRLYWKESLRQEQSQYDAAATSYQEHADYATRYPMSVPALPVECFDSLEAGKKRIQALQAKLAEIDAELLESPQAKLKRIEDERIAKMQSERQATLMRVVKYGGPVPPAPQQSLKLTEEDREEFREAIRHKPPTSSIFATRK